MQTDWKSLRGKLDKSTIFEKAREILQQHGFTIAEFDDKKPWGGYFVISEDQVAQFISVFFKGLELSDSQRLLKLSPKLLLVAPHQRLSWQYHLRRAEIWKLVFGDARLIRSKFDLQGAEEILAKDVAIQLERGERHRLIGKTEWGIVAEIWLHTDPAYPSDEDDIVRLEDDFSRV